MPIKLSSQRSAHTPRSWTSLDPSCLHHSRTLCNSSLKRREYGEAFQVSLSFYVDTVYLLTSALRTLLRIASNSIQVSASGESSPIHRAALFHSPSAPVPALWISEYIQTLPMEIEAVWKKKISGTSFLFLINRYSFLVYFMAQTYSNLPGSATDQE